MYDCTGYMLVPLALEGNVLLVIGGDEHYKDEDEKEKHFLSDWARKNISHQFRAEVVDGRKSFIFSWNKKHRSVHEEALLHYFDPSKKMQRFVYKPKSQPLPESDEVNIDPPATVNIQQEVYMVRLVKLAKKTIQFFFYIVNKYKPFRV